MPRGRWDKWRVPTLTLVDHRITCSNSSNFVVSQPHLSSHSCSSLLLPKIKLSLAYSLNPVFFFASSSLTPSPTILSFWNFCTAASCSIFSIQWLQLAHPSVFLPAHPHYVQLITKILAILPGEVVKGLEMGEKTPGYPSPGHHPQFMWDFPCFFRYLQH